MGTAINATAIHIDGHKRTVAHSLFELARISKNVCITYRPDRIFDTLLHNSLVIAGGP